MSAMTCRRRYRASSRYRGGRLMPSVQIIRQTVRNISAEGSCSWVVRTEAPVCRWSATLSITCISFPTAASSSGSDAGLEVAWLLSSRSASISASRSPASAAGLGAGLAAAAGCLLICRTSFPPDLVMWSFRNSKCRRIHCSLSVRFFFAVPEGPSFVSFP